MHQQLQQYLGAAKAALQSWDYDTELPVGHEQPNNTEQPLADILALSTRHEGPGEAGCSKDPELNAIPDEPMLLAILGERDANLRCRGQGPAIPKFVPLCYHMPRKLQAVNLSSREIVLVFLSVSHLTEYQMCVCSYVTL